MPRMTVLYEDWQMECCGTPFAVGDEVGWRLVTVDEEAPQGEFHGATAWVENHGGSDHETRGRVHAIDLLLQEYLAHHDPLAVEPEPGPAPGTLVLRATGRALEAVPGATAREPLDACPKWFDAFEDEEQPPRQVPYRVRRAVGVLVTLDVPDGTPPQPGDHR
ncbi:hypothetical protein JK359_03595 [Streptomyces actinomycinicus]|uniref:Uncharacterized protein n=1 Tax=Streptomyces actinomycinicus TaxID=1695166 RepID=A0A937EF99_9ACTN|nr:DUF6578 domain-containing protein [Streptomyces actinomycinicus]MBL1081064.1 hypothetical protein [Streptomyces actinomycinicus]